MTIDQGVCQPKADGYIRSLATRAKQLGVGSPVICLETEASYVVPPTKLPSAMQCSLLLIWLLVCSKFLITENGDLTVAVCSSR
jgi:hypothetical protein